MEASKEYPIRRYTDGVAKPLADPVVAETRIELDVNGGQLRMAMLCLPRDLEALAVGFLVGEGALRRVEDLQSVEFDAERRTIAVFGEFDEDVLENISLRWTWGSGCGSGGTGRDMDTTAYASVGPGGTISPGRLGELAGEFHRCTGLWRQTGGAHACGLCDGERVLLFAEDIGRHNAFDKIMGMAAMQGIDTAGKIVLTTGRLAGEIVSKAVACRVPILASRSAVTTLAIELARRFGLTLVGFVRSRRLNVYTGFERIVPDPAGAADDDGVE